MSTIVLYLSVFSLSCFFLSYWQRLNRFGLEKYSLHYSLRARNYRNFFIFFAFFTLIPIIVLYGVRYGLGADYFTYEKIYYRFHNIPFNTYWKLHFSGIPQYSLELGYFVLNRLAPSFVALQFIIFILISFVLLNVIKDFSDRISVPLAIFIYTTTQFIYAMNGIRFSIALLFIFWSYKYIVQGKLHKFILCIFIATTFHKTSLLCSVLYFMKEFKSTKLSKFRDLCIIGLICVFPGLVKYIYSIAAQFTFLLHFASDRYAPTGSNGSLAFLLHIVPVIVPLLVCVRKAIFEHSETRVLFRIYIMEIPFRMVGWLNTWFTRISRFAVMSQILFIPMVLHNIKNKKLKKQLFVYYIFWYIFDLLYYVFINDRGESLNYQSVF